MNLLIHQAMSAQRDRRITVRIERRNLRIQLKEQVSGHEPSVRYLTAEDIRFRLKVSNQELSGESWSPVSFSPYLPGYFYWNKKGEKKKISLN